MICPLVWSGRRRCCRGFEISRPWHGLGCQARPQDVPWPSCSLRNVRLRPRYSQHSMLSTVCRCCDLPVLWLVVDGGSAVPYSRYRAHGVARTPCSATGRALAVLEPQERPVAPAMLATLDAFTPFCRCHDLPARLVWSPRMLSQVRNFAPMARAQVPGSASGRALAVLQPQERPVAPAILAALDAVQPSVVVAFCLSFGSFGLVSEDAVPGSRCCGQARPQGASWPPCSLRDVRFRPKCLRHTMLFGLLSPS